MGRSVFRLASATVSMTSDRQQRPHPQRTTTTLGPPQDHPPGNARTFVVRALAAQGGALRRPFDELSDNAKPRNNSASDPARSSGYMLLR